MKAWSYSSLEAFETCPHRYAETKLYKRVKDPPNANADWGNMVHRALEVRVINDIPLPETMQQWETLASKIAAAKTRPGRQVFGELRLALNGNLIQTEYFAKDVWVRTIIDVTIDNGKRGWIGDYKTGKMKHDSKQLALSAAVTFATKPWLEEVECTFLWLKDNKVTKDVYRQEDAPGIWNEFMPRLQRYDHAHQTNTFPKKPSGLCNGWCPVKDCEFWKPSRR